MKKDILRTGDKDVLRFKFCYNNEYLKKGSLFLLREGRTKILGIVSKIFTDESDLKDIA